MAEPEDQPASLTELTADIVSAYVTRHGVTAADLPALITSVFGALSGVGPVEEPAKTLVPAVPIKRSVTNDALICLEDGRPFKSLKRHLHSAHGLSPEDYRARWGLQKSYPIVAPGYSASRSRLAKQAGLGQVHGTRAKAKSSAVKTPKARAKRR